MSAKVINTKISELSLEIVKQYLRLDLCFREDDDLIELFIEAAKSYIIKHTNRDIDYLDTSPEYTTACLIIISDLYEVRQLNLMDYKNVTVNNMLSFILSMDRDLE